MQVTIIGGGVIGLCSAYYLQKEGFQVTVLEANDMTDGCSFGNMGYVSPSHFIPLATPGIIGQGLKWMMSASSPFYIQPRFNLDLVRWGLRFWSKANARNVEDSAPHLNNLLQLSRALTLDLKQEMPNAFELIERGVFMLYTSEKTGKHEQEMAEQAHHYGLKTVICNAAQVQDYEKEVEIRVKGGVLYTDDCHLNPSHFMHALYQYLQAAGVQFHLNTNVLGFERIHQKITKIHTNKGDFDCGEVVIANGSRMGDISKLLHVSLLMQPGKGYSMVYDNLNPNLRYPSILVDDRVATTPIGDWLRIGGTMELSGHSTHILPKRVMAIYDAFKKYYPMLPIAPPNPTTAWYGYRPVSPDGVPYIGRHHQYTNLSYAGAHAMLGISAAAGTGKLMSELLSGKPLSIAIERFSPERR